LSLAYKTEYDSIVEKLKKDNVIDQKTLGEYFESILYTGERT